MKTNRRLQWFFIHLLCFLDGSLVDSSSPTESITTRVGGQAVLPCSWKSRLGEVDLPDHHVQWRNPVHTVFEQRGTQRFEAEGLKGRVEVPEEKLGSGDCSLIIRDTQIVDTGRYESFMVVDGEWSIKTRVFIHSVRLLVFDHKSRLGHSPGEDFVLELYTQHSIRVVFQGRNSSEWTELWMRDSEGSERFQKHPLKEQLMMPSLRPSDEGLYKVLDEYGQAVSTVQLYVEEPSMSHRFSQFEDMEEPTGDANEVSWSALVLVCCLISSLQILHLS